MNFISIVMDQNRNLLPDSYTLGVERDHGIEKIVLSALQRSDDLDLYDCTVALHLKADNGYLYNLVCTEKFSQDGLVYFLFPINREMTCTSGRVRVEFSFDNPAVPFEFTSRSVELMIAKPLTDTDEVESDYPGLLSDVLSAVQESSINVLNTQKDILELKQDVGTVAEATNIATERIDSVEAFLGYDDEQILGLEADFENSTFTRLAGAKGMTAGEDFNIFTMYGGRRRCNVSDDGTILAFYGDESYRDDGSNGQVMVYQPKFYYRVVPTKLEKIEGGIGYHAKKVSYYISEKARMGFSLHPAFYDENRNPVEYILYSAYEGNVSDNKLCSVAGAKPTVNKDRIEFESLAKARGAGWHIETMQAVSVNQLLFIIEYATFNSRDTIGMGVSLLTDKSPNNCASLTGSTALLGNVTGMAEDTVNEIGGVETIYNENGKVAVSYRGVENLWGNVYTHVSNANVWGDGTMQSGQLYVTEDFDLNNTKHDGNYIPTGFIMENGSYRWASAFGYGNELFDWMFAPSACKGTSMLPVSSYKIALDNVNQYVGITYGGRWDTGYGAGLFTIRTYDVGYGMRDLSARLIFIPTAK